MNIQQLRQSARDKWLSYYEENRQWLVRLGVWVNCDGQRRPSSSFILATLAILEPNLIQMFPLIVDLNSNPDRIVKALGLNFNPDEHLEAIRKARSANRSNNGALRLLAAGATPALNLLTTQASVDLYTQLDESCQGSKGDQDS